MSVLRTVDEQAGLWRCSTWAVKRLINGGGLVATKIAGRWLIDPADADAYAASQRSRSTTPRRPRRMRRAS